jgi:hypothetical protein
MMRACLDLAERLVSAIERIAAAYEQRQPAKKPRESRRGLRVTKEPSSNTVVPTEIDRARAAKVLKRLGYPLS